MTHTTYNVGDTVRYSSNSYVMLKDQQTNIQGSDATFGVLLHKVILRYVLTTRGDMITQNDGGVTRLLLVLQVVQL